MSSSELEGWRAVAGGWERRRAIFAQGTAPLTERLVELAELRGEEVVLELAAGPGETGFVAAAQLGDGGTLLSTDFAPEMVEVARRRGAELGLRNVEYRTIDAMAIALDAASIDAVLCRFGVMLTPDPAVALAEIRRVLGADGRAAIAVWAEPERNPWVAAGSTAQRELGLLPPRDPDEPGPFRLADKAKLRAFVEGAGLAIDVLEEVPLQFVSASLDEWWDVVTDMSPGLSTLAGDDPDALAAVRAIAEERVAVHVNEDGSVSMPGVALAVRANR